MYVSLCCLQRLWCINTAENVTYHRVTLFAIPEFKSLEVLKKIFLH